MHDTVLARLDPPNANDNARTPLERCIGVYLKTSELAAKVKLLTCMLSKGVASCDAASLASPRQLQLSRIMCNTRSEKCGLLKPNSYA